MAVLGYNSMTLYVYKHIVLLEYKIIIYQSSKVNVLRMTHRYYHVQSYWEIVTQVIDPNRSHHVLYMILYTSIHDSQFEVWGSPSKRLTLWSSILRDSFVGPCWALALLGPFICWALLGPGPAGAIHLLGPVGPIHLLGLAGAFQSNISKKVVTFSFF